MSLGQPVIKYLTRWSRTHTCMQIEAGRQVGSIAAHIENKASILELGKGWCGISRCLSGETDGSITTTLYTTIPTPPPPAPITTPLLIPPQRQLQKVQHNHSHGSKSTAATSGCRCIWRNASLDVFGSHEARPWKASCGQRAEGGKDPSVLLAEAARGGVAVKSTGRC